MQKVTLKKSASFKDVFTLLHQLSLTPFELGLMMSLITKMLKQSRYDNQAKNYYLIYNPEARITSEADSAPKIKRAFRDFQKKGYIKIQRTSGQKPKLFFNLIKIVK